MRQAIINFLCNINLGYMFLSLLFLVVILLFLSNKKINSIIIQMCMILYIVIAWIGFYYLNDIFNSIFDLKYLSVKLYLILLVIGNMIMLITVNKNINRLYRVTNYILFVSNMVILCINIVIIVANKSNNFVIGTISDATKLININFIIFIIYLKVICVIYIVNYLIDKIRLNKKVSKYNSIENIDVVDISNEESLEISSDRVILSKKEEQEGFYIDGVDCSIIFEDNDKTTIIKNYYILLNDINAKLVNGYTLQENIKLKKIINKLNIKDLNNIDLDINKLSRITIDEYNFLKKYLDNIGINI